MGSEGSGPSRWQVGCGGRPSAARCQDGRGRALDAGGQTDLVLNVASGDLHLGHAGPAWGTSLSRKGTR